MRYEGEDLQISNMQIKESFQNTKILESTLL